jgi:hypothetical protein
MAREQTYVPSPAAAQVVVQDDALPADINPTSYIRAGLGAASTSESEEHP